MTDREELFRRLEARDTGDLLEMLHEHDLDEWEPEVFEAARTLLVARGVDVDGALARLGTAGNEPQPIDDPVVVAMFGTVVDAEPARSGLLGAGFDAVFLDHNAIGVDPALWPALGGVKIAVPRSQAGEAREFLAQAERGELAAGPDVAIQCPRCGSTNVRFERHTDRAATVAAAAAAGLVAPPGDRAYVCGDCGETVQ